MSIEVKDLRFEYAKSTPVLDGINISIGAGTINVILGLNGCGKTTLIKLLAGLMKPSGGSITVDGRHVLKISDYERSKLIAYVPQLPSNNIAFTSEEYLLLSFANQKSLFLRAGEKDRERVRTFTKRLGIDEKKLARRVDELSGGERQIIMICGALMQDAKIIILDEPTAALDMKNQYAVLQFLKRCHKDENKTVIFSCHDPNHALRLGGRAIALHGGRVLLEGDSREIIKAENLRQIYGDSVRDAKDGKYNLITLDDSSCE